MNEVLKAIKERRSVRAFSAKMPKEEDLNAIMDAGLYAASGMNRQSALIIEVTNREFREKLAKVNCSFGRWSEGFDPFYGAPVIFIVLADKSVPTYLYDGSLVLGNMMLAAHSLGLGSIWIHRAKEEFELPEFKELLKEHGVSGEYEGIGHCAVGYPSGALPSAPARKEGRVLKIN